MLTLEYKLRGRPAQYAAVDEAIRTVQFIRNTCLRLWMDGSDGHHIAANDLQAHCAVLARQYPFVATLNSQARQQAADRAWAAISRFYANCRAKRPGKKGYPRFQRHCRSVEYKVTGWKLEPDGGRLYLAFTDGYGIGRLRLIGTRSTRSIETFPVEQIKRVRVVLRADGYYVQFCVHAERHIPHPPTGKQLGIDVGLAAFVTDSEGMSTPNPRYLRQAERKLKRLHRRVSRRKKGSQNRRKARKRLAKAYLHVSRQREDHARKLAGALISSCDWIAYEDLQIRNMVKNRHLARSISDASWARFLWWVAHDAQAADVVAMAVPPRWTSQDCSRCGRRVQKSLSVRTHRCPHCGLRLDRDHNAARNILQASLSA
ncbi:MAG TPA: transposase [Ktedonobacterales bacterium]